MPENRKRWPLAIKLQEESTGKTAGSTSALSHLNSNASTLTGNRMENVHNVNLNPNDYNRKMHVYGGRFLMAGRHIRIVSVFSCNEIIHDRLRSFWENRCIYESLLKVSEP